MTDRAESHAPTLDDCHVGLVPRNQGQLHDYPPELRWELTRRHPYYLACWEWALRYRRPPSDYNPRQLELDFIGMQILGSIGVTGEPVPPAAPYARLAEGGAEELIGGGSVQPVTLRAVTAMLLTSLPPAERAAVGTILLSSGADECRTSPGDSDAALRRQKSLGELARLVSPALDSAPDAPLFYVHLGASERSIERDLSGQVKRLKSKRGLGTAKVHTAKVAEYLAVWDAREGWAGGGYERPRERAFAEVARSRKLPLSTVYGHYRSAFAAVVGHDFSPTLWWRLFGPCKFSELFGNLKGTYPTRARHPLCSPAPRPIPDSVLGARGSSGGVVKGAEATGDDSGVSELVADIGGLIDQGLGDADIARRMGLDSEVIEHFRARRCELEGCFGKARLL